MLKRRIFIVDDSVVIRRSLTETLSKTPDIEVIGAAPNGRVALMKLAMIQPDVIALDVEMPEMNGLETLAAIQKSYPQLPVIMLNVPGEEGPAETLDALTMGARDYVTKPKAGPDFESGLQSLGNELAQKARAFRRESTRNDSVGSPLNHFPVARSIAKSSIPTAAPSSNNHVDVIAIGVSTGGPNALMELISQFPADFPVPILIVQHMPPIFTELLAQRLAAKCKISVAEGISRQQLLPGGAWIAPGDFHMAVVREGNIVRLLTHQGPPENSCRPAADVLFRSVAQVYGSHVLAVVMTGMGQDGFRGCEQIHAAGGQILVQDEASSVVWGMPSLVVKAGIANQVLPLRELAPEILKRVWKHRPHLSVR